MLKFYGGIAQLVEQATHNRLVTGSNPVAPTKPFIDYVDTVGLFV